VVPCSLKLISRCFSYTLNHSLRHCERCLPLSAVLRDPGHPPLVQALPLYDATPNTCAAAHPKFCFHIPCSSHVFCLKNIVPKLCSCLRGKMFEVQRTRWTINIHMGWIKKYGESAGGFCNEIEKLDDTYCTTIVSSAPGPIRST
jgi:hypothetical protein